MALVNEDFVMKALDFALEHEVHGMKTRSLQESVEMAKAKGDDKKAAMLVRRLAELKKVTLNTLMTFVVVRRSEVEVKPALQTTACRLISHSLSL